MNESDFKKRLQAAAREREESFSEALHDRIMQTIAIEKCTKKQTPKYSRIGYLTAAAVLLLVVGLPAWKSHRAPVLEEPPITQQTFLLNETEHAVPALVEQICPWKSTVETTAEISGVTDAIQLVSLDREHLPIPSRETLETVWSESAEVCFMPVCWVLE